MGVEVVILVDNEAACDGLATEHGFAAWIQTDSGAVLFDTGQGNALVPNAEALGIDFEACRAIVLSHGHYDHSGALDQALAKTKCPAVHLHPAALHDRYSMRGEPPYPAIGMPEHVRDALRTCGGMVRWADGPAELTHGVWMTGPIPRVNRFEDTGGAFYMDPECTRPDPIEDDQALWLETPKGLVVVLGCAHAGVINTLRYISGITGATSFHAIIGGMHLLTASQERLLATRRALTTLQVRNLAPCHCSGTPARDTMKSESGLTALPCAAGCRFVYP